MYICKLKDLQKCLINIIHTRLAQSKSNIIETLIIYFIHWNDIRCYRAC